MSNFLVAVYKCFFANLRNLRIQFTKRFGKSEDFPNFFEPKNIFSIFHGIPTEVVFMNTQMVNIQSGPKRHILFCKKK